MKQEQLQPLFKLIGDAMTNLENDAIHPAFPSIFSKHDVIELLHTLHLNITRSIEANVNSILFVDADFDDKIDELVREIKTSVEETIDGFDFDDNTEIEVNYRSIEVQVRTSDLWREIEDSIDDAVIESKKALVG